MNNSVEIEQTVLGMLINQEGLLIEYPGLEEKDFTALDHKLLIKTLRDMSDKSISIELTSIVAYMVDNGTFESFAGDVEYILSLTNATVSVSNFDYYYNILKKERKIRDLHFLGQAIVKSTANEKVDITELLGLIQTSINAIDTLPTTQIKNIKELSDESYQRLVGRMTSGTTVDGLDTGYQSLNAVIGGFKGSNVIVLAARPSIGKTALAINMALNTAKNNDKNVMIFSLEMSSNELFERMISRESKIKSYKYKYGKLDENDLKTDSTTRNILKQLGVFVDDTTIITVAEIKRTCLKLEREQGKLGLVIIDYLQLINPSSSKENKQVQVAQISRELKQLAKELDVCVIALSQLSREVEKRNNNVPQLSDLRDSGAIEADADVVGLMHKLDAQNSDDEEITRIDLIVAKNRAGVTGTVQYFFNKSISNFYEV